MSFWAWTLIDRLGCCQLLQAGISEQQLCYCQSSVLVHCATHTYAHGQAHSNANGRRTHTRVPEQIHVQTHINAHPCTDTPSVRSFNAPAGKRQENNKSAVPPPEPLTHTTLSFYFHSFFLLLGHMKAGCCACEAPRLVILI